MNYKEFTLIPTQKSDFVQLEIEDWARQNKNRKDASQKLMREDLLLRKIYLGIHFPLSCAQPKKTETRDL